MKNAINTFLVIILLVAAVMLGRLSVQIPQSQESATIAPLPEQPLVMQALDGSVPSCSACETEHIPAAEIQEYIDVAIATALTDQQVRSVDLGNAQVQVALAHRGPLAQANPRSVAVHNLVTEVYVVLSGSGTNVTGPNLVNAEPRPDDYRAVVFLNGPGQNAEAISNGTEVQLEAGDVFVIPAGTGHQFTRIDDHITYLMVRIDPDKVVPLLNAEQSRAYLDENLH